MFFVYPRAHACQSVGLPTAPSLARSLLTCSLSTARLPAAYPPLRRRKKDNISSDLLADVYAALNEGRTKYNAEKLTATFEDRKKYVVHFKNLKLYLKLGMTLKKVHRVLGFRQTHFLKTFIDFCTEKRSLAHSKFSQDLWKLIANSCYGKFLQQDKNRIMMDLCLEQCKASKLISSPLFTGFRVVNKGTVAVFRRHTTTKLNKFYAVGFSILEASKLHMYQSYYGWIQPHFGVGNVELLFSDTGRCWLFSCMSWSL